MREQITRFESLADITEADAAAVLKLSLQDLVHGGVSEEEAKEHLSIDSPAASIFGVQEQMNKFAQMPRAYIFYRIGGYIEGLLKYTKMNNLVTQNYSSESPEAAEAMAAADEEVERKRTLLRPQLAIQALVVSGDLDQTRATDMMIEDMLAGRNWRERRSGIIVPLHEDPEQDPATDSLLAHGFQPSSYTSEFVTIKTLDGDRRFPMKQRLHARKPEK